MTVDLERLAAFLGAPTPGNRLERDEMAWEAITELREARARLAALEQPVVTGDSPWREQIYGARVTTIRDGDNGVELKDNRDGTFDLTVFWGETEDATAYRLTHTHLAALAKAIEQAIPVITDIDGGQRAEAPALDEAEVDRKLWAKIADAVVGHTIQNHDVVVARVVSALDLPALLAQARREGAEEMRGRAAKCVENGSFLHDQAPPAIWARQAAPAIRALPLEPQS